MVVGDQRGREDRDQDPDLVKLHSDAEAEASRGQSDQDIGEAGPRAGHQVGGGHRGHHREEGHHGHMSVKV